MHVWVYMLYIYIEIDRWIDVIVGSGGFQVWGLRAWNPELSTLDIGPLN